MIICDWLFDNYKQIVTLDLFQFIAPVIPMYSHVLCIHSAISRLRKLVIFFRANFVQHTRLQLRQWPHEGNELGIIIV